MSKCVKYNGKRITHYECKDCGTFKSMTTLRPNGKFCDIDCRAYVLFLLGNVEDLPPEPGDEIAAIKMRLDDLEKKFELHRTNLTIHKP